jgi:uncharacterized membrane protein YhhN
LAVAAVDWYAVARENKKLEYVTKPVALAVLIAVAVAFAIDGAPARQAGFTIAALCFSLAGDVFLMLERDRFLQGLASFFFAHICYILAFGLSKPFFAIDNYLIVVLVLVGGGLYLRFLKGMREKGQTGLAVPVAFYVLAIGTVVYAAWTLANPSHEAASGVALIARDGVSDSPWPLSPRDTAFIGAVSFMISDALIGWTRFVRSVRWAPVAIIVTYHVAQAFLVLALLR